MTRDEFERITDIDDLLWNAENLGIIDDTSDYWNNDARNEYIWDDVNNWSGTWEELGSYLYNLEEGSDGQWWYRDDWGEWSTVEFDSLMDEFLEYGDNLEVWDEPEATQENDDTEEMTAEEVEEDSFEIDTELSLGDFFFSCNDSLRDIDNEAKAALDIDNENFRAFVL